MAAVVGLLEREYRQPAFRTPPPQPSNPAAISPHPTRQNPTPTPPPQKPAARPGDRSKAGMHGFIDRLARASDHYEVLNISQSAELAEIKREYHNIAATFIQTDFMNWRAA